MEGLNKLLRKYREQAERVREVISNEESLDYRVALEFLRTAQEIDKRLAEEGGIERGVFYEQALDILQEVDSFSWDAEVLKNDIPSELLSIPRVERDRELFLKLSQTPLIQFLKKEENITSFMFEDLASSIHEGVSQQEEEMGDFLLSRMEELRNEVMEAVQEIVGGMLSQVKYEILEELERKFTELEERSSSRGEAVESNEMLLQEVRELRSYVSALESRIIDLEKRQSKREEQEEVVEEFSREEEARMPYNLEEEEGESKREAPKRKESQGSLNELLRKYWPIILGAIIILLALLWLRK